MSMLTSCDVLHVKTGYLMWAILSTERLKCKEAISNKEKFQKDCNAEKQGINPERDQLFRTCLYLKFISSRQLLLSQITNQMEMWCHVRTVWASNLWARSMMPCKFATKVTSCSTLQWIPTYYSSWACRITLISHINKGFALLQFNLWSKQKRKHLKSKHQGCK